MSATPSEQLQLSSILTVELTSSLSSVDCCSQIVIGDPFLGGIELKEKLKVKGEVRSRMRVELFAAAQQVMKSAESLQNFLGGCRTSPGTWGCPRVTKALPLL